MSEPNRPGAVTWCGLAVVAAAAAALSFDALLGLAVACGIPAVLAWLLPICIDAAAVVASRMWLSGRSGPRVYRYARRLALVALGLSVAGNAAQHGMAAYGITPSWWVVVAVSAIPPAMLGAVAHLAALVAADGRQDAEPLPAAAEPDTAASEPISGPEPAAALVPAEAAELDTAVPAVPVDVPAVPDAVPDLDDNLDSLAARTRTLLAAGPIGRTRLARELDVSERQARRLLAEVTS